MATNEAFVSEAFSKQAGIFDQMNAENKLSEYLRSVYRKEVDSRLQPNSKILELNCGTGLDAMYFAAKGHSILATDNAPGMLEALNKKTKGTDLETKIETRLCSFHNISQIQDGPFDQILSNFGGLNCTNDLQDVLKQFSPLLKENGKVTMMIMPKVCPWELIMVFKGKFKTAFRRFRKNTPAHIEGTYFSCYYYNPQYVIKALEKDFRLVSLRGVFITVPPEFYKNFVERYPKLFNVLSKIDSKISRFFPFTWCCDHFLITLEKKKI